jgi:hypothetical protein
MSNKSEFEKYGEDLFQKTQFSNAINHILENMQNNIRLIKAFAKMRKAKYDALIDEGFTKDQALLIVTQTKVME